MSLFHENRLCLFAAPGEQPGKKPTAGSEQQNEANGEATEENGNPKNNEQARAEADKRAKDAEKRAGGMFSSTPEAQEVQKELGQQVIDSASEKLSGEAKELNAAGLDTMSTPEKINLGKHFMNWVRSVVPIRRAFNAEVQAAANGEEVKQEPIKEIVDSEAMQMAAGSMAKTVGGLIDDFNGKSKPELPHEKAWEEKRHQAQMRFEMASSAETKGAFDIWSDGMISHLVGNKEKFAALPQQLDIGGAEAQETHRKLEEKGVVQKFIDLYETTCKENLITETQYFGHERGIPTIGKAEVQDGEGQAITDTDEQSISQLQDGSVRLVIKPEKGMEEEFMTRAKGMTEAPEFRKEGDNIAFENLTVGKAREVLRLLTKQYKNGDEKKETMFGKIE